MEGRWWGLPAHVPTISHWAAGASQPRKPDRHCPCDGESHPSCLRAVCRAPRTLTDLGTLFTTELGVSTLENARRATVCSTCLQRRCFQAFIAPAADCTPSYPPASMVPAWVPACLALPWGNALEEQNSAAKRCSEATASLFLPLFPAKQCRNLSACWKRSLGSQAHPAATPSGAASLLTQTKA